MGEEGGETNSNGICVMTSEKIINKNSTNYPFQQIEQYLWKQCDIAYFSHEHSHFEIVFPLRIIVWHGCNWPR